MSLFQPPLSSAPSGPSSSSGLVPGGAGRNRTFGIEALQRLEVPPPPYGSQWWFNSLASKMESVEDLRRQVDARVDSLLPSILDKAFKGEL
ncbi:MAG: hypothetical protein KGM47_14405 [Acidobacteriota bacterium]|nr:hypothetical protein [Acidobacteriota bacterium]